MSMQELPDDQLDGLFRKSLEESEPPYDPTAWQAMQARLTAHDRRQFWQRWFRRVLPITLLVLLPVGIWLLTRTEPAGRHAATVEPVAASADPAGPRDPKRASTGPTRVAAPSAMASDEATGAAVETRSAVPLVSADRPDDAQPLTTPQARSVLTRRRTGKPISMPDRMITLVPSRSLQVAGRLVPSRRATGRGTVLRQSTASASAPDFVPGSYARTVRPSFTEQPGSGFVERTETHNPVPLPDAPAERFSESIASLRGHAPVPVEAAIRIDRLVSAPALGSAAGQTPSRVIDRSSGLSVRMLVSPDLSTIGLTNFSRPGTNVGLLLDYQYHRWRIQAGVLRSVKVYKASESVYDYQAPGQWAVVPNSIGGRCNMLDIPINLRYDVVLTPRRRALPPSRWFVSAGTTTYYMLREDYTYNYDNPADPMIKYRDWSTETGRYGFSQLNVSGGYERAITQRLFWQVEPFLKVPLKGVGVYKVNLLSTGAFLSLRYKL